MADLGMTRADRVYFRCSGTAGILRCRAKLSVERDRRPRGRNGPAAGATTSGKKPMSAARSVPTSALALSLVFAACAGEGEGDAARGAGDAEGQMTAESVEGDGIGVPLAQSGDDHFIVDCLGNQYLVIQLG